MRVFVAGGTGAIGRPLVARLLEHGHHVTVLTRSEQRAEKIRAGGSEAVVGDVLATGSLVGLLGASHPDIVVNQLTSLARTAARRDLHRGLADTARLRTEASASIMAAAAGAGVRRVVAQSIAFVYRPGPGTRTEDDPLYLDGPAQITQVAGPVTRLESETLGSDTVDGVVLRYGAFYGPGTYYAPAGAFAELARARRLPVVGHGRGIFGFVHVEDAAAATVAALTGPPGVYNVVDDRPAPTSEWVPHLARLLGAKRPRNMPARLFSLLAGRYSVYLFDEQPAVSNARATAALGWRPQFPDWHDGFASVFS